MDTATLFSVLKLTKSLKQIQSIHQKIITLGLQNNIALSKNLINLYISTNSPKSANSVLFTLQNPLDITLWNGLISSHTKTHKLNDALQVFERLLTVPFIKPDSFTYPSVLKACAGLKRVNFGKKIHAQLIKTGFLSDVFVASSLSSVYAKCGGFGDAGKLFDDMSDRDLACWNNVVSCYYQSGQFGKALEYFDGMVKAGFRPDSVSFTTAVSACGRLGDLERGRRIHEEVVRSGGVGLDAYVGAALVDMYGKCGCLEMAEEVFDGIGEKSLVCWNAMIGGYSRVGDSGEAIRVFSGMREENVWPSPTTISSLLLASAKTAQLMHGKFVHGFLIRNDVGSDDIFVESSLVDFYFKCGSVLMAERVFGIMPKNDIVAWNVMISGYVSVGCYLEALGVYDRMKDIGVRPDKITMTSALTACSQLAALSKGKELHSCIIENKLDSNEIVMAALLDMYSKCGAVKEAVSVFNQLPTRDLVSWTSMIVAYGSHGQAFEAMKLFDEMLRTNIRPDRVTFLAVISSCSHVGLVDKGQYYFNLMKNDYGIQPTIAEYSCLVDLLCRSRRLHEAYEILQKNPFIGNDADLLSTIFAACHTHGERELAEKISNHVLEKNLNDPSTYVVLEKIYAANKNWDEARKIRLKMKDLGLKKNPGCSWIEVDKRIQSFLAEDRVFAETEPVYHCLSVIYGHMEEMDEVVDSLS